MYTEQSHLCFPARSVSAVFICTVDAMSQISEPEPMPVLGNGPALHRWGIQPTWGASEQEIDFCQRMGYNGPQSGPDREAPGAERVRGLSAIGPWRGHSLEELAR
jgi:hypothetical protein